jgi:hypothetical protein
VLCNVFSSIDSPVSGFLMSRQISASGMAEADHRLDIAALLGGRDEALAHRVRARYRTGSVVVGVKDR